MKWRKKKNSLVKTYPTCPTFYIERHEKHAFALGASTEETMSRYAAIDVTNRVRFEISTPSPPSPSPSRDVHPLRFRSRRHRYEIMGIPIKHQPAHSTRNIPQTRRRGDRKCVSRNSTFGLPFPDEGGGSLFLSPSRQGKSKSSKRGLKDRKLRVLAVDRERWIVSPSPASPTSSRFSFPPSFSLRDLAFLPVYVLLRDSSEIREIKRSPRHTHRNVISVYVSSFEHTGERSLCFRERARISGTMPAQDSSQVDRFLLPVYIAVKDRDEKKQISKF